MKLTFFGAAGEVTGSCHILQVGDRQVLLDCGMIQGSQQNEARNRDPFPFDPKEIDAVILSHAHIDHSGRLPLLVKRGFRGPVYCQNATADLANILLLDSANISAYDAKRTNRKREREGLAPVEPLFSRADAQKTLKRLQGITYRELSQFLWQACKHHICAECYRCAHHSQCFADGSRHVRFH